jgi:hypothetical protein
MSDHDCKLEDQLEAVYLSPLGDGDSRLRVYQMRCEDPQEKCNESGFPWTKYVRADLAANDDLALLLNEAQRFLDDKFPSKVMIGDNLTSAARNLSARIGEAFRKVGMAGRPE